MLSETQKQNLENLRKIRAYAILAKGDMPKVVDKEKYIVRSQSDSEKRYTVEHNGQWTCTCPDHKETHLHCKHIQSVQMFLQLKDKADVLDLQDELENDDEVRCDQCNSLNVIKRGTRKTKSGIRQRYECKECGRRFTNEPIKHRKANTKLIALSMDLYYKGLSLRKIADTIEQFYGISLHHETIRIWINTFMEKINDYVQELEPNVGDTWHIDEQKIKAENKWLYSWNILDEKTRFLIANEITEQRSTLETRMVMQKAKKQTKDAKPWFMISDGMSAYPAAIRQEFGDDTQHIGNVGIRDRINNNVLERYHGTFRERDKVMRGMENGQTAREMTENIRTYYNFIRPHTALDGRTPAEEAGINLSLGRNRWMSLLSQAL
jgi:transposase-like protein